VLRGRIAEDLEGPLQGLELCLGLEDRLECVELCEDAAHGPHVHAEQVVLGAQNDLRGPIPE